MDGRPDPDALLEQVREEEARAKRGKLTIFFGAAPGVGKTYTMLEAARTEISDQGHDVVVGIVETHGRYDTGALLIGLELLPRRAIAHGGVELSELDLDAALARKPRVLLVDELAHTNAPGSRHTKRWQDVDDILDAGIDVFTTLNVQHLASLVDVVAQITGVVVREAVPDAVFDKAYEVRVVDLPVDELLERLREGKVYLPEQAKRAGQGFFREGNLIALRQLALRRTAERVDAKIRSYRAAHGIDESWLTGERVLVGVSPSPHSGHLIRAARRLATSLHAELVGLYVETPAALRLSETAKKRLDASLRLVESLGGEAAITRGDDAALETVAYARKRNVTKIVVGKPTHPRWRDVLRPSFLDDVVRLSREIDVYVISGEAREPVVVSSAPAPRAKGTPLRHYAAGAATMVVATTFSWFVFGQNQLADVAMVLLLGIVLASMRYGYAPSLVASVMGVLAFDYFFIPPFFTLAVGDLRHIATFAVMFFVGVVISNLTKRIREQADSARAREQRTASLYAMTREVGLAQSRTSLLEAAARHLREGFGVRVSMLTPTSEGPLEIAFADAETLTPTDKDMGVAEWVWNHEKRAGLGTDTLPSSRCLAVPLAGSRGRVGVLAVIPGDTNKLDDANARQLLDAFAGVIGSALERIGLADDARKARLRAETEQLRNALLSSVSHDLRTPLGVVTGATSALLDEAAPVDEATRRELLQTAHEEAIRLTRLVRNLLDQTRLEAGALKVRRRVESVEEVIGGALSRTTDQLRGREVHTDIPSSLVASCDPALVEQVLVNLIENAIKYAPSGTPIDLAARPAGDMVEIEVADRGPGVPASMQPRIFEKFFRVTETEGGGVGLGLTICKGIVEAHGGTIAVSTRPGGGAVFRFTLPGATATEVPAESS